MKFKLNWKESSVISTTVEILYEVQTFLVSTGFQSTTVEILYEVQTINFHCCSFNLQQ